MPPSRKPIIHNPSRNAPVPYLAYKLRSSSRKAGVGHIRPHDLAAQPPPSRTPTAPAEMFTAALLDGDILGLDTLQGTGPIENVAIDLSVEERLVRLSYLREFNCSCTDSYTGRGRRLFSRPFDVDPGPQPQTRHVHDAPQAHARRVRRRLGPGRHPYLAITPGRQGG